MSTSNTFIDQKSATETVAGIDTNADGDVTVTISELRQIENPNDVQAQALGGYVANVQSVDGNDVTFRIYQGGGADAELAPVTDTDGVTDLWVHAVGY